MFGKQNLVAGIHKGIAEENVILLEDVTLFGERGLDGFGCGNNGRASAVRLHLAQVAGKVVNHGAEDNIERLLLVVHVEQVVHVRNAYLGGEARIDGAALCAFFIELLAGVVGVDKVLRRNPQRFEVGAEDRRNRVHVQDARHADAQFLSPLHQFHALFLLGRESVLRRGISHQGRRIGLESRLGTHFSHVGVFLLHSVETLLDLAHVVHVLHQAFLAAVTNNQPLDPFDQGNLRLLPRFVGVGDLHIDKRPHALVLAEIATGVLVAVRGVADVAHRVKADELSALPAIVKPA